MGPFTILGPFRRNPMTEQHFSKFFAKLLLESDENHDSPNLFSLHKTTPAPEAFEPPDSHHFDQDQSPISDRGTDQVAPPSVQDQAVSSGVDDTPFEEAVPLEDELASLLDDIDD